MGPPPQPGDDPTIAVASLYQEYLVTRQTGRAVRDGIEQMISDQGGEAVAVIDFRDVVVIDFSCADEVVAKLVLDTGSPGDAAGARFVLVRGVREHHLDPVDGALRHRGLAVAAVRANGEPVLLGDVDPAADEAWRTLCSCGRIRSEDLARMLGLEPEPCDRLLSDLYRRRLVRRCGDAFESLQFTVSSADAPVHRAEPSGGEPPSHPGG